VLVSGVNSSRIWYLIKEWVENHWYDFEGDNKLQDMLKRYLFKMRQSEYKTIAKPAEQLHALAVKKVSGYTMQYINQL
jgi:hypothetical protein